MTNESSNQTVSRTMPQCSIIPVLIYPELAEALIWLKNVFGFRERWHAGDHRAQMSFGNGAIAICSVTSKPSGSLTPPAGFKSHSLLVRVDDVVAHYEHALKNGAEIIHIPVDFPYGEKQYTVKDIGGHIWTFSQSIADLAPEDWGATTSL